MNERFEAWHKSEPVSFPADLRPSQFAAIIKAEREFAWQAALQPTAPAQPSEEKT